ncbi:MAG: GNAT family N-acetyltransferase [Planctomycetia bacterium]|nr:GNAT family N-acetyltransferase [Planctomycetia bacterium]
MSGVRFPPDYRLDSLRRDHPRNHFKCGQEKVDDWLATKALQHQEKHLSVTKVLLDGAGAIAGYYTLATKQVDFADLSADVAKHLPRRLLPAALLAWFGISLAHQGKGLGKLLLAQALSDCYQAGQIFAFVGVVVDCIDDAAKQFYQRWSFEELPGHPYRLFLSATTLEAIVKDL